MKINCVWKSNFGTFLGRGSMSRYYINLGRWNVLLILIPKVELNNPTDNSTYVLNLLRGWRAFSANIFPDEYRASLESKHMLEIKVVRIFNYFMYLNNMKFFEATFFLQKSFHSAPYDKYYMHTYSKNRF